MAESTWTGKDSAAKKQKLDESGRTEDHGYRNLIGGNWRRDLTGNAYDKHLRVCADLWKEQPVAKKGVQNFRSFVAADGFFIRSTCNDPEKRKILQAKLDQHGRINNWRFKLDARVESLAVEGEWDYAITEPCPHTGHIRINKINPEDIAGIKPDPLDAETMLEAKLVARRKETWIAQSGEQMSQEYETLDIVRRDVRTGRLRGKLLHLPINQLTGQTRGWSDLLVVADYLDSLDLLVVGEVDRHRLMKVFAWVCKLTGADPAAVMARREQLRQDGPPQSNELLITDGTEEWSTVTPTLNLAESVMFVELLQSLIFGGLNMPQHYYSQGGDVNKATSDNMDTPVMAQVRSRKRLVMEFLLWEYEIALWTLYERGKLPPSIEPADLTIEVLSRDPERQIYQGMGTMLDQLGAALERAAKNQWISNSQAAQKFREAAEQMGLGEFAEDTSIDQARAIVAEKLAESYAAAPRRRMRVNNKEHAALW